MSENSYRLGDKTIEELVDYSNINQKAQYVVTFAAGDSYKCDELFWDEDNNGEEFDTQDERYEDWPVAVLHITQKIHEARNPARYHDWLSISRLHMPSEVTSDGRLLYSAEKGLFLRNGQILDTPRADI